MSDRTRTATCTVLDEYSRCLAIVVARRLQSDDVLQTLSELFVEHGPPANLRSDNGGVHGPSRSAVAWRVGCEEWYNESFNATFRQELLRREIFYSLEEAKVLIEQWRREYNTVRPHSLGYLPPAPIQPDPKLLNLPLLLGPHPRQNEAVRLTLEVVPLLGAGQWV